MPDVISLAIKTYGRASHFFRGLLRREDLIAALAIIFIAAILRVPFINYPATSVYDESLFEYYAINTVIGRPFFEPGPPLGWLLYSIPASQMSADEIQNTKLALVSVPFGRFPYVETRLTSAFFGILIPLFVYFIGRRLALSPYEAALPALFSAFDGGLILHSRIMMLETFWVGFGLAGLLFVLFALEIERKRSRFILYVLAGLCFGAALSVKWLSLGLFLAACLYLFIRGSFKPIVLIGISAALTYFFVLSAYLGGFEHGPANMSGLYRTGPGSELVFPGRGEWLSNLAFVIPYSKASFAMHAASEEVKKIPKDTHPYDWPVMNLSRNDPYWWPNRELTRKNLHLADPVIKFQANPVSWSAALIALIGLVVLTLNRVFKKDSSDRTEQWLIMAYTGSYVPLLLIDALADTPLWPFHYFPALLMSFFMIPFVVRTIVPARWQRQVYDILIFGTVIGFFAGWTSIYGIGG